MSEEDRGNAGRAAPRGLLIAGGIFAVLAIGGALALTLGDSQSAVGDTSPGFSGATVKSAAPAPNVKSDYHPTARAEENQVAPKTNETKNTSVADNTVMASVKSTTAVAQDTNPLDVISEGSLSAPITMIEYGSFSCSHCAEFDSVQLPKIRENYIDKGLVRLVFRPFSRNGIDVYAGLLVTCLQPDRRNAMIDTLFHQQTSWIPLDAPQDQVKDKLIANLQSYGRNAGLSDATVEQCLANTRNESWLQAELAAGTKDGVEGTPTFFVNGKKYSNMEFSDWQKTLNALLPKSD